MNQPRAQLWAISRTYIVPPRRQGKRHSRCLNEPDQTYWRERNQLYPQKNSMLVTRTWLEDAPATRQDLWVFISTWTFCKLTFPAADSCPVVRHERRWLEPI